MSTRRSAYTAGLNLLATLAMLTPLGSPTTVAAQQAEAPAAVPAQTAGSQPEDAADTAAAPKDASAAQPQAPAQTAGSQPEEATPVVTGTGQAAPAQPAQTAQTDPAAQGAPAAQAQLDPHTVGRALAEERARLRAMLNRPDIDRTPPPPVQPATPPDAGAAFAVGVRMTTLWNTDESYDLFADDDARVRGSIFVGYDVWSIRPDVIAALELGYGGDSSDERLLERFDTNLERQLITGAVDVRYVPWSWLQPHARVASGAHYTQTSLSADTGNGSVQDHWAPLLQAGVGATLRTPTRLLQSRRGRFASVSLGLKLEFGYLVVPPATVELGDATVGELRQSGPYLDAALVLRI